MYDIDFLERVMKQEPEVIGNPKRSSFSGFSIDSRTVTADQCFVGIIGEKFDGNSFAPEVSEKGVEIFILDKKKAKKSIENIKNGYVFLVKNTVKTLADLGSQHRRDIFASVVGITGSSGKTTTRELIAQVLSQKFNVHTAKKNLNTEIGLPLTMLDAPMNINLMVLEMGMNHYGEIGRLSRICEPLVGVVTNVGYAHIGQFGSLQAIADAKSEIYFGIQKRGFIFLNRDDAFYNYFFRKSPVDVVEYGLSDLEIIEDKGLDGYKLRYRDHSFHFPLAGEHNLSNLSAAFRIGEFFRVATKDMIHAVEKFSPVEGRSDIVRHKKFTVINDCYNANPSSTIAALKLLKKTSGRRIAVLSDMLELGRLSEELHRMVGKFIADNGCADEVWAYGEFSKMLIEEVKSAGIPTQWFAECSELTDYCTANVSKGDTVLVKASRGMHLEDVVNALLNT